MLNNFLSPASPLMPENSVSKIANYWTRETSKLWPIKSILRVTAGTKFKFTSWSCKSCSSHTTAWATNVRRKKPKNGKSRILPANSHVKRARRSLATSPTNQYRQYNATCIIGLGRLVSGRENSFPYALWVWQAVFGELCCSPTFHLSKWIFCRPRRLQHSCFSF
jgi:hypothetical protein